MTISARMVMPVMERKVFALFRIFGDGDGCMQADLCGLYGNIDLAVKASEGIKSFSCRGQVEYSLVLRREYANRSEAEEKGPYGYYANHFLIIEEIEVIEEEKSDGLL
jgi:hypothetical protein